MKKRISAIALAGLLVASSAQASGYRIPEQSVDSTAKAGANIASSTRADASYFNPANMAWMEDSWHMQGNLTYIHLAKNKFSGTANVGGADVPGDDTARDENFIVPTGFVVSPDYNGFRFGFALTAPYGLSKRWDGTGAAFSKEFSLTNIEANPTLSYKINNYVSLAAGARLMYAKATLTNALYDMTGDTWEWGYNGAVSVRPFANDQWNISATYRSNIDLDFSENDVVFKGATVPTPGGPVAIPGGVGKGSTSVPAAAVFALSTAFKPVEKLTVELTWDRTFWSEYKELTIENTHYPADALKTFDKSWDDSDAFRVGLNYQYSPKLDLMAGFTYDKNPAPDKNVGYELPDSDAWIYSVGFQYAVTEQFEYGVAVLYDYKEERKVSGGKLDGEFTDGAAFLVTVGMSYKF